MALLLLLSVLIVAALVIAVAGGGGTLNLSDVPVVMLEAGNMRDRGDAAVMTSKRGQGRYARALAAAVRRYLG